MESLGAKMGAGPKKKKPAFLDDTSGTTGGDDGDDSVDPRGGEAEDSVGEASVKPANAAPEDETGSGDMGGDDAGEGPELGSYGDVEDNAASELASLAGVPPAKVEAFKSALSDYIAACIKKQGKAE